MPEPFPCGTPYSKPCPPQPCVAALAKLTPSERAAVHAWVDDAYNKGRVDKTAEYELAMQEIPDTTQD